MAISPGLPSYQIGKSEAAAELGIRDRRLVGYLIRVHQIPVIPIGTKHCLDATGFELLRRRYEEFKAAKG